MIDILYSLFTAIYNGIVSILSLIVAIPRYVATIIGVFTAIIPVEVFAVIMVGVVGYVVIHVKRLIF